MKINKIRTDSMLASSGTWMLISSCLRSGLNRKIRNEAELETSGGLLLEQAFLTDGQYLPVAADNILKSGDKFNIMCLAETSLFCNKTAFSQGKYAVKVVQSFPKYKFHENFTIIPLAYDGISFSF